MTGEVTLVAHLYLDPDRKAECETYEAAASRIMSRYGGRIERRIGIRAEDSTSATSGPPDEIHIVTFPNRERFEEYVRDPGLKSLRAQRELAIRHTVIWPGTDLTPFE